MTEPQPKTKPIADLKPKPPMTPEQAVVGLPLAPIKRMAMMEPGEWEEFTVEWVHSLKSRYHQVERCAGSGDLGRDVIATMDLAGTWDNYQCKHYDHVLAPGDVWFELGKLCYHSFRKEFTLPRAYYFAAPQGLGPKLTQMLKEPEKLREGLIEHWDKKFEAAFAPLDGELRAWVDTFDFSIFKGLTPLQMFDYHRESPHHVFRFGGALPPRPPDLIPPADIEANEQRYVEQLFGAYGDEQRCMIACSADLEPHGYLKEHFARSRVQFYCAESLRNFSRDNLPAGEFGRLQDQVFAGVVDVAFAKHDTGFRRVVATTGEAKKLPLDSHPLYSRVSINDRFGICHQLVNHEKLRWIL